MSRVTITLSLSTKERLKSLKNNKTWDLLLNELIEAYEKCKRYEAWFERTSKLEFEDYGNPDCNHKIVSEVEASGETYYIVWRCEKCDLEAYQILGVREFTYKDVIEEAKKYWERVKNEGSDSS